MQTITVLDVGIVLALAFGTLNGLRKGAAHQLGSLFFMYVSVILSTRFYHMLLPHALRLLAGAPTVVLKTFLYCLLLMIIYALFGIVLYGVVLNRRPDRRIAKISWKNVRRDATESLGGTLNHLGGLMLGFVTATAWISIGLLILGFFLNYSWLDWDHYRRGLSGTYKTSILVPVFKTFLPYLVGVIEPWFPGGIPAILFIR